MIFDILNNYIVHLNADTCVVVYMGNVCLGHSTLQMRIGLQLYRIIIYNY